MAVIYELQEPLIGNGSSVYIDTGLQLFNNTITKWTILLDFNINNIDYIFRPILDSLENDGTNNNGFTLGIEVDKLRLIFPNDGYKTIDTPIQGDRHLFILKRDGKNFTLYDYQGNKIYQKSNPNDDIRPTNLPLTLLAKKKNTTFTNFNDGTINRLKIYNEILETSDCLNYLNGVYEDGNDNQITEDDPTDINEEYQDNYTIPISTGSGDSGIEGMSEDSWGNENYGLPCALYFYYMGDDINAGNEYENWNTEFTNAVLGNCSAIQSVQYVPFLRKDDMQLNAVPYDVARFGQLQASHPKLDYAPYVYRIKALTNQVKTLGSFKCYEPQKSIGGKRSWKNESRLYNYPYQFAMITDHLNKPMEVKYHLVPNNNAEIKVLNTISDRCSYGLYVEGYKGDNGRMEAMVSTEAHELPCSSSAYNQWYASNKNQVAQNVANMSETAFLNNGNIANNQKFNIVNTGLNSVGNLLTGNILGAIGSVSQGFQNNMNMNFQQRMNNVGVQQQVAMNMALGQDLRSTPNTMISMGSDVYYGLAKGNYQLDLYRFGLTNEYYNKLGDYFAMYGYKQNRVMTINIANRYYYNYIKTVGVNIFGEKIPRNHLEKIKQIFDNGVTIWHTYRDGVTVGDYSMDNKEV